MDIKKLTKEKEEIKIGEKAGGRHINKKVKIKIVLANCRSIQSKLKQ
jgi:hypothetical protein